MQIHMWTYMQDKCRHVRKHTCIHKVGVDVHLHVNVMWMVCRCRYQLHVAVMQIYVDVRSVYIEICKCQSDAIELYIAYFSQFSPTFKNVPCFSQLSHTSTIQPLLFRNFPLRFTHFAYFSQLPPSSPLPPYVHSLSPTFHSFTNFCNFPIFKALNIF